MAKLRRIIAFLIYVVPIYGQIFTVLFMTICRTKSSERPSRQGIFINKKINTFSGRPAYHNNTRALSHLRKFNNHRPPRPSILHTHTHTHAYHIIYTYKIYLRLRIIYVYGGGCRRYNNIMACVRRSRSINK